MFSQGKLCALYFVTGVAESSKEFVAVKTSAEIGRMSAGFKAFLNRF